MALNIFVRLERMLEEALDGLFRRSGGRLQPVEIARRLARALEDNRRVSVSRVYAPNAFRVALATAEYEALLPFMGTLTRELSGYLLDVARRQEFSFLGPVSIEFEGREGLAATELKVEAWFAESSGDQRLSVAQGPEEEGEDDGATRLFAAFGDGAAAPAVRLAVVAGPDSGVAAALGDGSHIGRQEGNELRLSDPKVSRRHARIERRAAGWTLVDLQSTNGTAVNGERSDAHRLEVGDAIEIGNTRIEVRELP